MTWHDSFKSANKIDKTSPAVKISIYGGEEEGSLSYLGAIPASGDASELGVLKLNFNADIKLAENATASLFTNDTTLVEEVPLALSKDSANAAVADFGNERLLVYNKYSVKVPKEAIMINDTTNTTLAQDILVSYTGTSYYLFNYKTITPDSSSVLSTIGEVVLIPEFPAGSAAWQYCGDDAYKGNVSLYKGTDETGELIGTYEFDMGTDLKSERGNVTALLDPNETYALVIPEGLVPTRGSITIPGYGTTNMRQTHRSAKTIVLYIGANTATRDATSTGWGTICLPYAATPGSNVTTYEIDGVDDASAPSSVIVSEATAMEAGKPYIYRAVDSDGTAVAATFTQNDITTVDDPVAGTNSLAGVFTSSLGLVSNGAYILSGGVWYKVDNSSEFNLGDNRAYIADMASIPEAASGAKGMRMTLNDGGTTGIKGVADSPAAGCKAIYTLSGQRVSKTTKGNLYIVDGKKVLAR